MSRPRSRFARQLDPDVERTRNLKAGVRLEIVTVVWMVVEAAVSLGAGIVAGSILLTAFGLDSLIELVSGSVLLWRLLTEVRGGHEERGERVEAIARWVVAVTLGLLCAYVLVSAVYGLVTHSKPESSVVGIGVSVAAVLIMPFLAIRKRTIARRIGSAALEGDAAESVTCAYMAATVLVGLLLNATLGWWWAEGVAALVFLFWLVRETVEAVQEAREGEA
jgi:divalent metal cation (Fe/Co/Zn/Cd) transporter